MTRQTDKGSKGSTENPLEPLNQGPKRSSRLVRNFVADPQTVFDAGRTEGARQQVRTASVQSIAHDPAQSDLPVINLNRNANPVLTRSGPKGRVFVEALQDQLLEIVVIQHSGLCASDCLCSHVPPRAACPGGAIFLIAKGLPFGRWN